METEIEDMEELTAHLYSAHRLAVLHLQRLNQRRSERLRKAAQRHHAPTTLPQSDSAPQRELRSA
jgi:hypothetical protein